MVKTVNEAFYVFLRDYVNLDHDETESARNSRDWLLSQIHSFPYKDNSFPRLYSEKDIFFGSFARRTKKRELDDIDIMIALSGEGGWYNELTDRIEIYVSDSSHRLQALCIQNTNILSSRRVINKFISLLNQVSQYEQANIKRNGEAATLNLKSYSWTFDLVPCFFTQKEYPNKDYYLIPDGQGYWKKTDPRIDRNRVTEINQFHNGNILNVIRLMKYWNRRTTMPSMSSYLIENMILDFYDTQISTKASQYVDLEVPKILQYIKDNIFYRVSDPKGIQGDINHKLSFEEKTKISKRAYSDYIKSQEAIELETKGEHKLSITKWREVFGLSFPIYT